MSEKRFQLNMGRNPSKILDNGKVISKYNAVVLLNKFYKEIQTLKEENEQLLKDVENLQEVVAELGATLLMNGFEIEINNENLSELINDE